jgi:hypothetical protein
LEDPKRVYFHEKPQVDAYEAPRLSVPTLFVDTEKKYKPGIDELVSFILE